MPLVSTIAQHGPPRPLTANQQRAMAIEANPVFWRTMTVQGIVDRLIEAVQIEDILLVINGLQQLQKAFHCSADVFRFGLIQKLGTPLFLLSLDLRSVAVFVDKHFTDSAAPLGEAAGDNEAVTQSSPLKRPPSATIDLTGGKRQCLEQAKAIACKLGQKPGGTATVRTEETILVTIYGLSPVDRDATLADDLFTIVHDGIGVAPAGFRMTEDQKQAKFALRHEEDYLNLLKNVHRTRFKSSTLFVNREPPTRCQPWHPQVEIDPWPPSRGPAELYSIVKTLRIGAYCPSVELASAPVSPTLTGHASTTPARAKLGTATFRVPSIAAAELAVRELANSQIDPVDAITATWSFVSENKRSLSQLGSGLGAASEVAEAAKAAEAFPPSTPEQSSPAAWRYEPIGAASSPRSSAFECRRRPHSQPTRSSTTASW